jgi:hypothetical protein
MPRSCNFIRDKELLIPKCYTDMLTATREGVQSFPGELGLLSTPVGAYQWDHIAEVLRGYEANLDTAATVEGAYFDRLGPDDGGRHP